MLSMDWPVKTLGDVCYLVGGGTPSKDRPEFYGGGIPWATVRDLNVEVLRTTEHSITAEAVKSSSSNVIPEGSVVIATRVGLGKAVILAQDTAINQDLRGLVVKNPNEVLAVYLFWWYLSTVHLVVAAGTGATVQGVKLPFVSKLAIPVPPLDEQKRIVELLDAATASVAELTACYEQARTHAGNLFESLYNDCFKQQSADTPLGDIADLNGGYAFKSSDYTESGVFVLRTLNIDAKGGVTRRKPAFVSNARMGEFDRFKLFVDDILFVMVGATLGKTGVVKEADLPALLNQNMWVIRAKNDLIDPRYLYFVFMKYSKTLLSGAAGTARAFVKRDDFRNLMIPVPTLDEQKRIVARLDTMRAKTSEMVAAYDAKLRAAIDLRQSVLEAAFAGEL